MQFINNNLLASYTDKQKTNRFIEILSGLKNVSISGYMAEYEKLKTHLPQTRLPKEFCLVSHTILPHLPDTFRAFTR